MKIYTHNEKGQKIEVEYEQCIVEDDACETPIKISNYEQFKFCVRKDIEQNDYVAQCRTKKYGNALSKLLSDNRELYMQYRDRLDNEYRENFRKHYDR